MIIDQGAAYKNQVLHAMDTPNSFSMKPRATIFCAAPVLIPMFQMETDWTAVMTSNAPSRLLCGNPNAATIPSRIGTTAPARAVALGTKNANTIETRMAPKTMAPVFTPTLDKIYKATAYGGLSLASLRQGREQLLQAQRRSSKIRQVPF